jgi:2',3'-cyclic-nucleotide 2'-phosphodiesterase/3'-nucleotidase
MKQSQEKPKGKPETVLRLRLLETTDVHVNLTPFDYFTNTPVKAYGLTRTATLIHDARSDCRNSLLLDNGDFLQGTPISDLLARRDSSQTSPHPAIRAMNALGYDAAGLGNHEFNFGLEWLKATLSYADFPITCANLECLQSDQPLFAPFILLNRALQDEEGKEHDICIGITSLVPPQTTMWDQHHLAGRVQGLDIIETAQRIVPQMRAEGADLVIVLAHSGIVTGPPRPMMENAALQLGNLPGIDGILAGHTHEVFPGPAFEGIEGVSSCEGTLNGTPAVMAGARGSHLGVLDLELRRNETEGWRVVASRSIARALTHDTVENTELREILEPTHTATVALASEHLGVTPAPLNSYLALVRPCPAITLITQAKIRAVKQLVEGTSEADLPVLAAAASFKTGGRAGPFHYTDIPAGPLCLRHAADLYSFPNLLCVLRLSGADLRDWLERAAVAFNRISPHEKGQFLCNRSVPGHQYDVVDGLSYEIDLSAPPRYDLAGRLLHSGAGRIRKVMFQGAPLDYEQVFLLATNNYRMSGAGPYAPARPDQLVHISTQLLRDVVADHILSGAALTNQANHETGWSFAPLPGTEVLFDTGPGLRNHPDQIAAIGARDLGDTKAGFMRLAIPL